MKNNVSKKLSHFVFGALVKKILMSEENLNHNQPTEDLEMKKMSTDRPQRRNGRGRPGRRGNKVDVKVKLERSRQSARECRARKKLRYQYLEDLVSNREQAIFKLREELELYKHHSSEVDGGVITDDIREKLVTWESENTSEKTTENDNSSENSNSPGCVIKEELSTWCDDSCTRT